MDGPEIRALARLIDRMDYYRLLRVEQTAPVPVIRSAYQRMRRKFHPDAFARDVQDVQNAVDRIAKRLNEAYLTLRDAARRGAYDRLLSEQAGVRYGREGEESKRAEAEQPRGTTPNGRRFFAQAEGHAREGDVARAIASLKLALTFEPTNAHFKARLEALSRKPG